MANSVEVAITLNPSANPDNSLSSSVNVLHVSSLKLILGLKLNKSLHLSITAVGKLGKFSVIRGD